MLKAKFEGKDRTNARNYSGEKEKVSSYTLVAVYKGKIEMPVTVVCYMGRSASASVVYASIWVHGKEVYRSGSGSAGGYGYHKESTAIQEAISSAGIVLYGSAYSRQGEAVDYKKKAYIGGVGDYAIKEAIYAIGRALGYRKMAIVE
jgi:hypothetical protein